MNVMIWVLVGFIGGGSVACMYWISRREREEMQRSIKSLQDQLKGKLPSYVTRNALEDIVSTDLGTEHDRISLRLYLMEGLKRLDVLDEAEERRTRIAQDLRTGRYDPDKAATSD